jgi:hypothetical protein
LSLNQRHAERHRARVAAPPIVTHEAEAGQS